MVCGLISYWDEKPEHLLRAIASLAPVVDTLVAVDGRYEHYPSPAVRSPYESRSAVEFACEQLGLELVHYSRPTPWPTEREKREFMFKLAESVTTEDDWFIVLDGDSVLEVTGDLDLTGDVAEVMHVDHYQDGTTHSQPLRVMFRAQRGIGLVSNHFTYVGPDGRVLWGKHQIEATDNTSALTIHHLNHQRDPERAQASIDYYRERDALGIERSDCERCLVNPATRWVPAHWENTPEGPQTNFKEVCEGCIGAEKKATYKRLRKMGYAKPAELAFRPNPTSEPVKLSTFFTDPTKRSASRT